MSPTKFEHFVLDLAVLQGLRNAVWRTPGSDGGRDIEGDVLVRDFSGEFSRQRWYIECKHYVRSIDWPTVRDKLAYAENHSADYLLLCTTSTPSPTCKTEIAAFNSAHRTPLVRVWDGAALARMLEQDPLLAARYLPSARRDARDRGGLSRLIELQTKASGAAYGSVVHPNPALEYLVAVADLIAALNSAWSRDLPSAFRPFRSQRDLYGWSTPPSNVGALARFDRNGLRAILAAVRFFANLSTLAIRVQGDSVVLRYALSPTAREAVTTICLFSDIEARVKTDALYLNSRRR